MSPRPTICIECAAHRDHPLLGHICEAYPHAFREYVDFVTGQSTYSTPSGRETPNQFPKCGSINTNGTCAAFSPTFPQGVR